MLLLLAVASLVILLSHLSHSLNLLEMVEGPGLESNYIKVEAVEGEDLTSRKWWILFPKRKLFQSNFIFQVEDDRQVISKFSQNGLSILYFK